MTPLQTFLQIKETELKYCHENDLPHLKKAIENSIKQVKEYYNLKQEFKQLELW